MDTSIEDQRKYYNERWQQSAYINRLKLERCIAILESLKSLRITEPEIIDLGCGTGWLSSILAHIGPTVGVDLSDVAVGSARLRYPYVEFIQADIQHWDHTETGPFDVVVSQEVIEHFTDQQQHLRLAFELLRPQGFLILTTPNARTFAAMPEEQRKSWSGQPIENLLDRKALRRLAEPYFDVLTLRTIIPSYGSKGIYRFFSSGRIKRLSKELRLDNVIETVRLRMGLGLHLVFVAQKKPQIYST
jgi:SAM-dependent methyltransferase